MGQVLSGRLISYYKNLSHQKDIGGVKEGLERNFLITIKRGFWTKILVI